MAQRAAATTAGKSRLTASDWTDAALELLAAEGRPAITINRLCGHLGVTRGSFYWHFADLEALHEAVTERWCEQTRAVIEALAVVEQLPPVERLRAMTLHLLDDASSAVERGLRDWARADERVAVVVNQADLVVLDAVTTALVDLGRSPEDARVLGGLLVYAGIGFAHDDHGLPRPLPDDVDRLLGLLG